MKLTYRGVSYEHNPAMLEVNEGEIGGKYRGTSWKHHYPRHIPVPQPKIDLKYRGVAYCTGDPVDVEAALLRKNYAQATSQALNVTNEVELHHNSRQQVLVELNQAHLNNVRRSLEHRLQVAREQGDRDLIRLLEAEVEQIA